MPRFSKNALAVFAIPSALGLFIFTKPIKLSTIVHSSFVTFVYLTTMLNWSTLVISLVESKIILQNGAELIFLTKVDHTVFASK